MNWYLQKRKQQAIAYQQGMAEDLARQQRHKEEQEALAVRRANEALAEEAKRADDINFLMNSPIPHFDEESPPTIREMSESPYHLEIGKKRVVEDGRCVWVPTLVAKDGEEVVYELTLCSRANTGQQMGNLHIPDIKPIQQMVEHHNQSIRRNEQ